MAKSTKRKSSRPAVPLTRHPRGYWCKKVRGKIHYFGRIVGDEDGQKALNLWLEQRDDLLAGRTPRSTGDSGPTMADVCNRFLTFKQGLLDSGELAKRTFERYHATCSRMVEHFGRTRLVADLRPEDFERFREAMAALWGPIALGNEIQTVRSVFRYAFDAEVLDKPVRTGPGFRKPSAKTLRLNRAKSGPRMFEADEIRVLLDNANANGKAMVLLGVNGALGNTDIALLPTKAVDLEHQWLDYPREKTGVPRRIPLWPETVAALRDALAKRVTPKDKADSYLFFIGPRGDSYVGKHRGYRVTSVMVQLLKNAKLRDGLSFYDLRRTFQTVGEGLATWQPSRPSWGTRTPLTT